MVKVLGLGDSVCDIYLHSRKMYPGGQALNFAVFAKMLGVQSEYIGVLGTDIVAKHILSTLEKVGVEHDRCRIVHGESGFACVHIMQGERLFLGSNQGGVLQKNPIELSETELLYLTQFDVIHTSNNSYINDQLPVLSQYSKLLSYDFSIKWNNPELLARVCPYIDIGFISCSNTDTEEVKMLLIDLQQKSGGIMIATRGRLSCLAYDGEQFYQQSSYDVEVVDTMGAGDSFAACFLVNLVKNKYEDRNYKFGTKTNSIFSSLQHAAEFAAHTCLSNGAFGHGIDIPKEQYTAIERVLNHPDK